MMFSSILNSTTACHLYRAEMTAQTILQPGPVGGSSRDSGSWWCIHSCANQRWVCSPTTALPPRQQLYMVSLGDSAQKQNQNSMRLWPSDKHKATKKSNWNCITLRELHEQRLYSPTNTGWYLKFPLGSRPKFPFNKHTNISSKICSLLLPMAMKFQSTITKGKRKLDLLTDKPNFRAKKYLDTGLHHWLGQFSSEIIRTMSEMAKNAL